MPRIRKQQSKMTGTGQQIGAVVGEVAGARAANAALAVDAICASHSKQSAAAISRSGFVRERATHVATSAAEAAARGARSGVFEEVKGHFIEGMTIRDYNRAGRLLGKGMRPPTSPINRAYDAVKLRRSGFVGGVQVKSSAAGVEKAVKQIERVKPGSAAKATLMVPEDQVAAATRRAAGRIRVRGNGVTRTQATKRMQQGVKSVSKNGTRAPSRARVLGKAGAIGAAVNVGVGGAKEVGALRRGELGARHFVENRAIDAAEGGTGAVVGSGAAAAGSAAAATLITNTAGGAAVASWAGAMGSAALPVIASAGPGGAAVAGAAGALTAPVALPAIAGAAVAVGAGIGVAAAFKRVRSAVDDRRDEGDDGALALSIVPRPEGGGATSTDLRLVSAAA